MVCIPTSLISWGDKVRCGYKLAVMVTRREVGEVGVVAGWRGQGGAVRGWGLIDSESKDKSS